MKSVTVLSCKKNRLYVVCVQHRLKFLLFWDIESVSVGALTLGIKISFVIKLKVRAESRDP